MSTKKEAKQAANKINFIVVVLATNQLIYIHAVSRPTRHSTQEREHESMGPQGQEAPEGKVQSSVDCIS